MTEPRQIAVVRRPIGMLSDGKTHRTEVIVDGAAYCIDTDTTIEQPPELTDDEIRQAVRKLRR
jgi:hypothetical protein